MKTYTVIHSIVIATIGSTCLGPAQTNTAPGRAPAAKLANITGPKMEFAASVFDFGKIESGQLIKHDFVFTNTGAQRLEVTAVRPSCGCTTAGAWDKQVEPGQTGKIPVQFNSGGYSGTVAKTVFVACNDAAQSNVVLQLKGTIWKPIDIAPLYAMFNLGPDVQTNQTRVLRIISNLEEPVTLSEPAVSNPAFKAELKTVREGKEFELDVTVLTPLSAASVSSPITLKTSASKMPVITANAYASVQPVVTVVPAQLTLPTGPLTNTTQYTLTIQNNSTNALVLSEPGVNAEGGDVQIREMQRGRLFGMTVSFPAGFQAQPGQVFVTAKSDHPRFPLIKVPVYQMPPPAKAAVPSSSPAGPVAASSGAPRTTSVQASGTQAGQTTAVDAVGQKSLSATNSATAKLVGPKIQVGEAVHDFGRLESGKVVTNSYTFTNAGNQPLEILDVKSSCGCAAAANWTRRVEPGKTGTIPVVFDSGGMAGPVMRSLWLLCNDPGQSNVLLQFEATVWKPIDAVPATAVFSFGPDFQTNLTRVIRLVSNLEEPVTLSEPVCTNRSFRAELKTVKEGKEFELQVTVIPPLGPGSWSAPVTLKTSSPRMPVVTATAYAVVQPALAVAPPRLMLPPTPLVKAEQVTVTIQNKGTNAVALSEPSLNAQGAQVQLREVQPGRLFELTMTFPAGFRSQTGQTIEASVKCNHPQSPIIKVPILEPRPLPDSDAPAAVPPEKVSSDRAISTTAAVRAVSVSER